MHSKYPPISIVWLKRDLRLDDHEAICSALNSNNKVLLLYVAENTMKKHSLIPFTSRTLSIGYIAYIIYNLSLIRSIGLL